MKKIVFLLLVMSSFVSCLDAGNYLKGWETSTFEYSQVDYAETFGSDSLFFDVDGGLGMAWRGIFVFYHKVENKDLKGGFLLSYLKPSGIEEKPQDFVPNPYKVAGPAQPMLRNTYAVFSQSEESMMPERDFRFMDVDGTCLPMSCRVNNTEAVYEAVKKSFEPGDELKLIAQGYLKGALTLSTEIKLAADTTMYNWTKFDLSPLGPIDAIDFRLECTDPSIPLNFCLDDFAAQVEFYN